MAKAPRPGAGKRQENVDAAKLILRIRIKDRTLDLAPNNLTIAERSAVRKQTGGLPFETYWDEQSSIGLDSIMVLWWLARRADGEPNLLLRTVEETWPELREGDLHVEEITPDAEDLDDGTLDSPEA